MAVNQTSAFTDGTASDAWQSMANRQLLERGKYALVFNMPMRKDPFNPREGKTKIWRRYEALPLVSALSEGINPASRSKTKTDVAATMAIYGDVIEDTDFLVLTSKEGIAMENVALLGQQMGESIDAVDRDTWTGITTHVFSNGAAVGSVNTILDQNDLDRTFRTLRNNKARFFTPMIMASQKVGTSPIMPSFWGMTHEDVLFDLKHLPNWRWVSEYSDATGTIIGEVGADKNGIRFLSSPNGKVVLDGGGSATGAGVKSNGGTSADLYSTFVVGEGCAYSVELSGQNGGVIVHSFGESGVSDALDMRMTTGWKKFYVSKVVNSNFGVELFSAASL